MSDLDFIKDKELRSALENSIEYIYALFEESKNREQKQLYKEETNVARTVLATLSLLSIFIICLIFKI